MTTYLKTFGFAALILALGVGCMHSEKRTIVDGSEYKPTISPQDFTTTITNPHFTLTPGTVRTYQAVTDEGTEKIEVKVTKNTKKVMGIKTVVVRDRVWLDGELIEDTKDWYAQDKDGNVWYFGEDTAEYENGKIINHNGAWEAGVDGAQPGIVMYANPKVGDSYRQEYYAGEAEDIAEVKSLAESVEVPFGTYSNCLKTYDYTPLDPESKEYKYYCAETGGLVLEEGVENGQRTELISLTQK